MINTIAKMRKSNQAARKWLEERGYSVWLMPHLRYSKDMFSLFDGWGYNEKEIILIQIKSNCWPSKMPYFKFSGPATIALIRVNDAKKRRRGSTSNVEAMWLRSEDGRGRVWQWSGESELGRSL